MDDTTCYSKSLELISELLQISDNLEERLSKLCQLFGCISFDGMDNAEAQKKAYLTSLKQLNGRLKKLKRQDLADDLHASLAASLPELVFPEVPKQAFADKTAKVDLALLDDAETMFLSWEFSDEVKNSFKQFRQKLKDIIENIKKYDADFSSGNFSENAKGKIGDFFKSFVEIVAVLKETVIAEVPWVLMKQIAIVLNDNYQSYRAAYNIINSLLELKKHCPSNELVEELEKLDVIFLRNSAWSELDAKMIAKDYAGALEVAEQLMRFDDNSADFEQLKVLKEKLDAKVNAFPYHLLLLFLFAVLIIASCAFFVVASNSIKKGEIEYEVTSAQKTTKLRPQAFIGKSGLQEQIPLHSDLSKTFTLEQVRYAVFQKMRIDYIEKQDLTDKEIRCLKDMKDDYNARCYFYKYNLKDREQVAKEAIRYKTEITQDAKIILKNIRNRFLDYSFITGKCVSNKADFKFLSLANSVDVKKIQQKLNDKGFNIKNISGKWDKESKNALMRFKAERLKIFDNKWDKRTQKALFRNEF